MPAGFGGGMPGGGRSFHFSTGGGPGGFSFSDPSDIFSSFFRSGGAGMGDDDDVFANLGGMGGIGSGRGRASGGRPSARRMRTPEVTVVEKPLPVSLEELFNGTEKKLKINRKTYDPATGKQSTEVKILQVPIKKGLKAGDKIKFTNVGDQIEGGTQDIHFIIAEKEHPLYKRVGDDLRHDVEITLKEALTGWQKTVATIDGKQVSVSGSGPTPPTYMDKFPGLGMPKSKKPLERGDFLVGIRIKFPLSLTVEQKRQLKDIL